MEKKKEREGKGGEGEIRKEKRGGVGIIKEAGFTAPDAPPMIWGTERRENEIYLKKSLQFHLAPCCGPSLCRLGTYLDK